MRSARAPSVRTFTSFSTAFCWHPRAAVPSILKEVKRRKKKGAALPAEFLADCARRALKADRYRNIAIEKIYEFSE